MKKNPFIKPPLPEFKKISALSKKEAEQEINLLREAIEYHNELYYSKNKPEISDKNYDGLFQRLEKLEKQYKEFRSDTSPTKKVGAQPSGKLKKRKHASPMLSLDSSDNKEDIKQFFKNIQEQINKKQVEVVLEPKLDGLSVEIAYKNGKLLYAATRGNGQTGEDITENIKTIDAVPSSLRSAKKAPEFLSVRGEVLISKDDFQKLNKSRIENGEEPFANPRNAAAGISRQLDAANVKDKPLDIFFYEIIDAKKNGFDDHWEVLKRFKKWGLKIHPQSKRVKSFKQVESFFDQLTKKRETLKVEIDGLVVKVRNYKYRKELGTRQRNPKWAVAWKFPPKKEITTLQQIVVQVGRTGMLTPVALFDPVEVGGVTVSRATLHNEDEAKNKDVRSGDTIRVMRAGDVIPEVVERVKKGKSRGKAFRMPSKCPVCQTKVVREGAYVVCPAGLSCNAQKKGHIIHFVSLEAMDIRNLGEKNIEQLMEKGLIKAIPDLYKLSREDLLSLEGFKKRKAERLHEAIQKSKNPELHRFLYALGIRHVGEHMARVLALNFKSLDKLKKVRKKKLTSIDEIGEETAESISNFFSNKENLNMLKELKKAGVNPQKVSAEKADLLKEKTIVITGELEDFSRDEAKEKIEFLGGRATSSVSGNTNYVVVGEDPGSKLDQAKKRNVKTINEKQFHRLLKKGKV